jgi:hypothetical protein
VRGVLSAPESTATLGDDALAGGALEAALGTADI